MKTQINSFTVVLALALSGGLLIGFSLQGVEGEILGLGMERPSGKPVSEEIHATLKNDEGGNRQCATYDHAGSNGSRWRTKWC